LADKKEKRKQKYKDKSEANLEKAEIKQKITTILKEKKPNNVRTLTEIMESDHEFLPEQVLPIIKEMENSNEIKLQEPIIEPTIPPKKILEFFWGRNYFAYEFWMTITTIALVLTLVLLDVRSGIFFYLRYAVVCFFMLILSGWSLTSVIFPELNDNFRFLERVATAIGLSIVILVLDGLFLNYTFRFNVLSIALSLTLIILICLMISIILRIRLGKFGYIFKKEEEEIIEVFEG